MAYNGKKVVQIALNRGLKAKDFRAAVFPDRTGNFSWKEIEKSTNPNAETIEATANLLQCSIDELFDREAPYSTNNVTGDNNIVSSYNVTADPEILAATNQYLRDVINRQDKTIVELNRRIDHLIELAKRP